MVILRMTHDQAQQISRYLSIGRQWPSWEFPGLEVEFYDPDSDVDDGELQIIIKN